MNDWEPDFQPDELSDLVLSVASGAVDKAALTALFELHEANAAMTRMLVPILEQVRNLIGPRRRVMIVFDRGGWSPKRECLPRDWAHVGVGAEGRAGTV